MATDPDADRLGIFAKDAKTGEYMTYTGNMSALLIAEYRISQMKEKGILPSKKVKQWQKCILKQLQNIMI